MLQLMQLNVTTDVVECYSWCSWVLQLMQLNVTTDAVECYYYCTVECYNWCSWMLQLMQLNITADAVECYSWCSWMLQLMHLTVASDSVVTFFLQHRLLCEQILFLLMKSKWLPSVQVYSGCWVWVWLTLFVVIVSILMILSFCRYPHCGGQHVPVPLLSASPDAWCWHGVAFLHKVPQWALGRGHGCRVHLERLCAWGAPLPAECYW